LRRVLSALSFPFGVRPEDTLWRTDEAFTASKPPRRRV
jgi:hypothetical protein